MKNKALTGQEQFDSLEAAVVWTFGWSITNEKCTCPTEKRIWKIVFPSAIIAGFKPRANISHSSHLSETLSFFPSFD
jgi:hypothetical protein